MRILQAQAPADIDQFRVTSREMTPEELTLEARLDRVLTPEMKQRLQIALAKK